MAFVVGEDGEGVVGAGGEVEAVGGAGGVGGELVEGAAGGVDDGLGVVGEVDGVGLGGPAVGVAVEDDGCAVGAGGELGVVVVIGAGLGELLECPVGGAGAGIVVGELKGGLAGGLLFFGHGVFLGCWGDVSDTCFGFIPLRVRAIACYEFVSLVSLCH